MTQISESTFTLMFEIMSIIKRKERSKRKEQEETKQMTHCQAKDKGCHSELFN